MLTKTSPPQAGGRQKLPGLLARPPGCPARAVSIPEGRAERDSMEIGMLPGFPDKEESHGVYKKNQTKISVAETAFLINPLVFAERLGGKGIPRAAARGQEGGEKSLIAKP